MNDRTDAAPPSPERGSSGSPGSSGTSGERVEVSRDIAAPADLVWAMVADVTRMGEWSPEAVGHEWLGDADGPARGARFRGRNRRGRHRWSTVAEVVACEPGRSFVFEVSSLGLPVARWSYTIVPAAEGDACTVTEGWVDERGTIITVLGRVATGVGDRATHNRAGMAATLAALAEAAEAAHFRGNTTP